MAVLEQALDPLLHEIEDALREFGLDATWQAASADEADGRLNVRWQGGEHAFLARIKRKASPAAIKLTERPAPGSILLTEQVTPALADLLERYGWEGYVDSAGNAALRAPGLLVQVSGRRSRRTTPARPTSPFTRTGLPVTFAVLVAHEQGRKLTQRDLVRLTGDASLGTVNRVLQALRDSGHRDAEGHLPRLAQLQDQWIASYVTTQPEAWPSETYASSRWASPKDVLEADLPKGALIGSESAAAKLGVPIRPTTALVYCPVAVRKDLVRAGRLRRDSEGPITIRPAFWSEKLLEGATSIPPFLVRADLLLEDDPRLTEIARTWKPARNAWT